MNTDEILQLETELGTIQWIDEPIEGFPQGWFLLETTPVPPQEDLYLVTADIIHDRNINVTQGKLHHSKNCRVTRHNLTVHIERALRSIQSVTFQVAVFPGHPDIYDGNPIAIPLQPRITYDIYPDHPHLSWGGPVKRGGFDFLPDSICYTNDGLGSNETTRLRNAVDYLCIWLFRHQVWLETRKLSKPGEWIGPQVTGDTKHHALRLDPRGRCWCGRSIPYQSCHMVQDVAAYYNIDLQKANLFIMRYVSSGTWENYMAVPHRRALRTLREALLR